MTSKSLLIGLVAGFSLFSACGTAAPPAATAPAASVPASTAPAGQGGGGDELIGRMAAAQAAVKTYSMDMTMATAVMGEAAEITMEGKVDQTDKDNVKMSMSMDFAGMQMKMLKVDGKTYIQMGLTGDKWMLAPDDQASQYDSTADQADLGGQLQKMKDSITAIDKMGEETVDGVSTTHYRFTIDAAALKDLTGSEGTLEADTFTYDVWVDQDALVRKVEMELNAEVDGKSMPLRISGTMGNYNEPMDISAPEEDQIMEMPS